MQVSHETIYQAVYVQGRGELRRELAACLRSGPASRWNTDPVRPRKLLLHGKQIRKLIGASKEAGLTLVPLDLYISGGYIKVTLALARGKKLFDKRETLKKRDAEREIEKAVKNR